MKVKRKKSLVICSSPLRFGYNEQSELSSASLGASPYAYDYDNIGNRKTAQKITEEISYDANNINQYSYGHDLTKNITELYHSNGTIATTYDYSPFGALTATGTEQPYQWSSEYYDTELGLVYYNYRHYNPKDGRWINRDPIAEQGGLNLYGFIGNNAIVHNDLVETYVPGASSGTVLHPSAYDSANPCRNCPKGSTRTRLPQVNSNCCTYKTKKQKSSHKPKSNGCGPEVLPVWDSFNFFAACNVHDICYDTCGSSKETCDKQFLTGMKNACFRTMKGKGSDLFILAACLTTADVYYNAVALLDFAYENAQDDACEWNNCSTGNK